MCAAVEKTWVSFSFCVEVEVQSITQQICDLADGLESLKGLVWLSAQLFDIFDIKVQGQWRNAAIVPSKS